MFFGQIRRLGLVSHPPSGKIEPIALELLVRENVVVHFEFMEFEKKRYPLLNIAVVISLI